MRKRTDPPRMPVLRLPCRAKAALLCGMNFFVQHSELRDLYDKVAAGERISTFAESRLFCSI